jgi:hypothetical protein
LLGGSSWGKGKIGGAIQLDGRNGRVQFPAGLMQGIHDFTIATWVKLDSIANWVRIFDFGDGGSNTLMFLTPQNQINGLMRFSIRNGLTPNLVEAPPLVVGTWQHVAVSLSGMTLTLYLNGNSVANNPSCMLTPNDLGVTDHNTIGESQTSGDPYLNGSIDEFMIYDQALSVQEIQWLAGVTP